MQNVNHFVFYSMLFPLVTKLREHWDETNSKVTQRKTQLDTMLADSQNYESKRIEVETWLQRMETRLEIIAPVGHTADVLEAQIREQKVSIRTYQNACEIFLRFSPLISV